MISRLKKFADKTFKFEKINKSLNKFDKDFGFKLGRIKKN